MMKVSALQMVSSNSLSENLQTAERLITEAAGQAAQLIVLPECFSLFGCPDIYAAAQQEESVATVRNFLSAQAKLHGIYLVGGTLSRIKTIDGERKAPSGKVFASVHTYDPKGSELARYDKIHLFDAGVADSVGSYRESDTYAPGGKVVVVDAEFGRLGFAVCYDLRFPALSCKLQELGVDVLVAPSAFTEKTGEAHWLPLLRARAIENQCLLIAPNQGGDHGGGRKTFGHSCIVDAWGEVLALKEKCEGAVVAEWDQNQQKNIRQKMPLANHRVSLD